MKKLFLIFILSFAFNFIWENLHSLLYQSYKSAPITEFILFRATIGDALMLTLLALPFLYLPYFTKRKWLIIPIGIILALAIELFALSTGRWSYNELMPLIPFL